MYIEMLTFVIWGMKWAKRFIVVGGGRVLKVILVLAKQENLCTTLLKITRRKSLNGKQLERITGTKLLGV